MGGGPLQEVVACGGFTRLLSVFLPEIISAIFGLFSFVLSLNRVEKFDVTLPCMVAKFLDHSNGKLKQQRWHGKENSKKAKGLYQQNNNFARALPFSVHFLAILLHDCDLKLPNFTFSFSNLDTAILSDSTTDNFANI